MRTKDPIACIEGEITDKDTGGQVYCKLAFWANGGVYYVNDSVSKASVYILMISPIEAKIFQYPEFEKEETN